MLHRRIWVVDEFTIPNYEFPGDFNDAILATQLANQQNLQAKQHQEKARTEAETAVIVAQGLANAQKAQATTLTPEYLQLQAINKWNGQLPQYLTPNAALPFIGTAPTAPAPAPDEVAVAALEIVMVAAAILLLITLFLYLWQRLGLLGRDHAHASPPHEHLDVPPHDHGGRGSCGGRLSFDASPPDPVDFSFGCPSRR